MPSFDLIRGLHILSIIAWMAGLLYLPRLYVYHARVETAEVTRETLRLMAKNLLRVIMNPAMIASWAFGSWLLYFHIHDGEGWRFLIEPWFVIKEIGIIGLTAWHHYLAITYKNIEKGTHIGSETYWRRVNEVPFVLAIIMVLSVTTQFWTL